MADLFKEVDPESLTFDIWPVECQTVIHLESPVEMRNDGHDINSARVALTHTGELECLHRGCSKERVQRKAQPLVEIHPW